MIYGPVPVHELKGVENMKISDEFLLFILNKDVEEHDKQTFFNLDGDVWYDRHEAEEITTWQVLERLELITEVDEG